VFVDGEGLPPSTSFAAMTARSPTARSFYTVTDLVRAITSNGLLYRLFEAPVLRIVGAPGTTGAFLTRALDVVGSAIPARPLQPAAAGAGDPRSSSPRRAGDLLQERWVATVARSASTSSVPCAFDAARRSDDHRAYMTALINGQEQACKPPATARTRSTNGPTTRGITGVGKWLRRTLAR